MITKKQIEEQTERKERIGQCPYHFSIKPKLKSKLDKDTKDYQDANGCIQGCLAYEERPEERLKNKVNYERSQVPCKDYISDDNDIKSNDEYKKCDVFILKQKDEALEEIEKL